ncbi:cupredoxin domain-containing protein [Minwuia sp.]|uniref:cupredoxin domain-containing protein n=1 Tax=Minwuia sp. TaxID=2493630 RepID=UPI003A8D66C3
MKIIREHTGLTALVLSVLIASGLSQATLAAGSHDGGHGARTGYEGERSNVSRTINVDMYDNYFEPKSMNLKEGETVLFVVTNKGEFVHEFNIATAEMHAAHETEMMQMMEKGILEVDRINHSMMGHGNHGMRHDHANSVLLEPGETGEVIWTFDTHAKLEFACNVPGHYGSGMVGKIKLSH